MLSVVQTSRQRRVNVTSSRRHVFDRVCPERRINVVAMPKAPWHNERPDAHDPQVQNKQLGVEAFEGALSRGRLDDKRNAPTSPSSSEQTRLKEASRCAVQTQYPREQSTSLHHHQCSLPLPPKRHISHFCTLNRRLSTGTVRVGFDVSR